MKTKKLLIIRLPVEYDPAQTDPEKIVRTLEHSTLSEVLSTIQDSMGDGETVQFGALEPEEISWLR